MYSHAHTQAKMATPLTDAEKKAILDFSRPNGKSGRAAWNALCAEIKRARGGQYPSDWHALVIRGKLFDDENLPPPRSDDLSDVNPVVQAFMAKLRANATLPSWAT